jgi:DNA-binding response OmpR family regulator
MATTTLSGSVLIIDDDVPVRQTFARILRQAGCEVITAADGAEAMQRLAGASYDLAYLDIHLPGKDGLQVLKEVHQLYPQLPVILFTGHATLQSALEAMRLGAMDYLVKPVDPDTLISRTQVILTEQSLLRRRREIQAQIEALQSELKKLEAAVPPSEAAPGSGPLEKTAPTFTTPADRFLKRGPLILDLQARRATFGGRMLTLPPAAFDYLVVLTRHAPDVVSYQTLVAEAQGYQTDLRQAQELAKWHIHELRESIEPEPQKPRHVLNVRGTGYRLVVD